MGAGDSGISDSRAVRESKYVLVHSEDQTFLRLVIESPICENRESGEYVSLGGCGLEDA